MIHPTERAQAILNGFRAASAKTIGQWDGYSIVGDDNTFRGPSLSSYVMSTRVDGDGLVLRIQRRDRPWRREIRVAPNHGWRESTNGGAVEHGNADFHSQQHAIIARLFEDIKGLGG